MTLNGESNDADRPHQFWNSCGPAGVEVMVCETSVGALVASTADALVAGTDMTSPYSANGFPMTKPFPLKPSRARGRSVRLGRVMS